MSLSFIDPYVKEAATVGLLEGLQNTNHHKTAQPEQFETFLLPETRRWWQKVSEFWRSGKLMTDDGPEEKCQPKTT